MYAPDRHHKIYSIEEWWSDRWNPLEYWALFNFGESFFIQWQRLFEAVPKVCVWWMSNENSEYTNFVMFSKDCYLIASGRNNERCLYSRNVRDCINAVDCLQVNQSEDIYEVIACSGCTNLTHSFHVFWSRDSSYLYFCEWCDNCFWCVNLTNKSYHIFNKPYPKEDYILELKRLKSMDPEELKSKIKTHLLSKPRRALNSFSNEWTATYDYIRNSKEIKQSSFIADCENISYSFEQEKSHDLQDCCMGWWGNQFVYESVAIWMNEFNDAFCITFTNSQSIYYCESCYNSSNLFGCVGLRNAQYCILNKQYSKEEYEILVPKIIELMESDKQWWEFFPPSISPFWYNETIANEYFPLDKAEATKNEFNWSDYENPKPEVSKIIPASKLPAKISEIPDDIINWAIECSETGKPFRIIKSELEFYRKHDLPLPHKHPDIRHIDRMHLRNPRELHDRRCEKCSIEIKTTYSPNAKEIVYCNECYNKEIV
ncbi:MAG: hypothetical protein ACD_3C00063G0001 [uncultured bacterium (gcode 4)]|uniref:Uncharacterized protein n=1 Tax=uncultured bacterium (gcode 4) TaxID=1234023 RepID=K2GDP0_9BACT|nr:MAG: hypothetical protein ACD_3C00063G0001 [uncultured bacterium (gcode 4)]